MMYPDRMFFLMDRAIPAIFGLVFLMVMAVFAVALIKKISEWNGNNQSPVLDVEAFVVSRRTNTTYYHQSNGTDTRSAAYYVTFQVESMNRLEFKVSGTEYGQIAEGDQGKLTFQGTRFLGFDRAIPCHFPEKSIKM